MNAFVETLSLLSAAAETAPVPELAVNPAEDTRIWDPARFAREQISALVRRVFFPGWPHPSKHVVFTTVECEHDITHICRSVAETLAAQVSGTICLVDANSSSSRLETTCTAPQVLPAIQNNKSLKDHVSQLSANLWSVPAASFVSHGEKEFSAAGLENCLSELRRQFDYTVIHAPAAGAYSHTRLLAHLSDGVVLVLNAERTRRIAARHARNMLQAADAKLLGTVLDRRPFPIPQALYRRL